MQFRWMTPEDAGNLPEISPVIFCSESVSLRITRTGFLLSYLPAATAEPKTYSGLHGQTPAQYAGQPGCSILAIQHEDEYIGWCACNTLEAPGWLTITDIRIQVVFRKQGLAANLLNALEQYASGAGFLGLRAIVSDEHAAVCQFFQHTGFQLMGLDRLLLTADLTEQMKPLLQRRCALCFYRTPAI